MKRISLTLAVAALMITSPLAGFAAAQEDEEHYKNQEVEPGVNNGYDGGPVELTLYHHLFNLLDKAPMNTQPMDPDAPDISQGYTFPTAEADAASHPASNPNEIFLYNSPGPVHYNESLDEPRFHPERGLGYDLLLGDKEPTVYWYMSADALETLVASPEQVGAMPDVEVTATLRLGDSADPEVDLTEGEVVSQGSTTVSIMTTPGGGAQEIEIPMSSPSMDRIPAEESFNLHVEWTQVDENGVEITDRQWKLHSGEQYPNRINLEVENPIRLHYVHPQILGERKVAVHTAFVTPLGNYDVDLEDLTMTVTDEAGNTVIEHTDGGLQTGDNVRGPVIVQKSYGHNAHHDPVLVTWVWDHEAADADPGTYNVEVSSSNLQNSATAQKTAAFTLSEDGVDQAISSEDENVDPAATDGESQDSPLGVLPVIAALLGALAIARVRRR